MNIVFGSVETHQAKYDLYSLTKQNESENNTKCANILVN